MSTHINLSFKYKKKSTIKRLIKGCTAKDQISILFKHDDVLDLRNDLNLNKVTDFIGANLSLFLVDCGVPSSSKPFTQ